MLNRVRLARITVVCLVASCGRFMNAEGLLWEDRFGVDTHDVAKGVAVSNDRVVAVGNGDGELVVRSYNTRTGTLEWWDQTPGGLSSVVMDDSGRQVFVTGATRAALGALPTPVSECGKTWPTRV